MAVPLLVVATAFFYVGQAVAFVQPGGLALRQGQTPRLTSCLHRRPSSSCWSSSSNHDDAGRQGDRPSRRRRERRNAAQTQSHVHKTPLAEDASNAATEGRSVVPEDGGGEGESLFDELLARCAAATKSDAATESSHTGSSEWAGFKTNPELLEVGVLVMPCCVGSISTV